MPRARRGSPQPKSRFENLPAAQAPVKMPKDAKKKKVKGGMDAELEALLGQLSTLQVRVGGGSAGTTEAS